MRFNIDRVIEGEYYPGYFIIGMKKKFISNMN